MKDTIKDSLNSLTYNAINSTTELSFVFRRNSNNTKRSLLLDEKIICQKVFALLFSHFIILANRLLRIRPTTLQI